MSDHGLPTKMRDALLRVKATFIHEQRQPRLANERGFPFTN
jgi:hypothetical protein